MPNNVYYSQEYKAAMDRIGKPRYTVVNQCLAELLHGLPKNFTKVMKHPKVKKVKKVHLKHKDRLRGVSLFSGVGALDKGLEHAIDVKVYYEKDAVAQRVLQSLIHKGMLSPGKIHGDVANAKAKDHLCIYYAFIFCIYMYHRQDLRNVDILVGGFPCPDIAIAGKKAGFSGKRSVLFKHVVKVAVLSQAPFVFLENVANILSQDMQPVFADVPKVMLQRIQISRCSIVAFNTKI